MALLETASVASVMPFLSVLGDPNMIGSNDYISKLFLYSQNIGVVSTNHFMIFLGVSSFVLIIISAFYRTITLFSMNNFVEMCRHSISSRLLESYLSQSYSFFISRHSSDMTKTILSEVDQLTGTTFRPVFAMFANSLVFLALTIFVIIVNPFLAIGTAGLLCFLYLLVFLLLKSKLGFLGQRRVSANEQRFLTAGEALLGIKYVKVLGCERSYVSKFKISSFEFAKSVASHQTLNQIPKYLIEAFSFGGIIVIVLFLMLVYYKDSLNALGSILPVIGLYAFSAYRLQPALQAIFSGVSSLRYGTASVDKIYSDIKKEIINKKDTEKICSRLQIKEKISLQNLSFKYSNSNLSALQDINLVIPVGNSIALVGQTGSGKTTLVDVLLGLLHPSTGCIKVDGLEISEKNRRSWQMSLGYVPQDIFLTDTSLSENIALGLDPKEINYDQVRKCARMAQIESFIENELPQKYDTRVGDRGIRLSGGQKQRIGIARALYHDPDILIFDEATSALDSVTENSVMQSIESLSKKKTVIIIAHRLSTVKNCDEILLLDKGKIVEQGTYDDLANESLIFKDLIQNYK